MDRSKAFDMSMNLTRARNQLERARRSRSPNTVKKALAEADQLLGKLDDYLDELMETSKVSAPIVLDTTAREFEYQVLAHRAIGRAEGPPGAGWRITDLTTAPAEDSKHDVYAVWEREVPASPWADALAAVRAARDDLEMTHDGPPLAGRAPEAWLFKIAAAASSATGQPVLVTGRVPHAGAPIDPEAYRKALLEIAALAVAALETTMVPDQAPALPAGSITHEPTAEP